MWVNITILVISFLLFFYISIILLYRNWFLKLKPFISNTSQTPTVSFSVLVPARNEEENIEHCIRSIYSQEYPADLFEVIIINDHSTDKTSEIVQSLQHRYASLKLIQLQDVLNGKIVNAYKKKAIATAIEKATGDWIVTTDADCIISNQWLKLYDHYIQQNNVVFIAAPVLYQNTGKVSSIFQCLDFISLQAITAASVSAGFHSMCNGANLAYQKKAFHAVNGFRDIEAKASGDDMLLMHKIKKNFKGRIGMLFSQDAIVKTHPMPNWKSFFNQRIRWASKVSYFSDYKIISVLLLLYLLNISVLILPIAGILNSKFLIFWVFIIIIKAFAELLLMKPAAKFFKQEKLLRWFWLMQPIHIIYTVVAGFMGIAGSYEWKGRNVK